MNALTRAEWDALWRPLDDGIKQHAAFGDYVRLVDSEKARWLRDIPQMSCHSASNRRWVVHLEDALARGLAVTPAMLDDVTPDDMRFDAPAFPLLGKALAHKKAA